MKELFKISMLTAALLVACGVSAGVLPDSQIDGGATNAYNYVAANSTNVYAGSGTVLACNYSTDATLEFSFKCTGASTANYIIAFDAGINGSNSDRWLTNAIVMLVAGKGTGTAIGLTNLPSGARYPFYRVNFIGNTNASSPAMTNVMVRAFTKTGI